MALQNMNPGGALGIGQMLGRRIAPFSGGPGMPLSVQQAGGGGGMPNMPAPAAQEAAGPQFPQMAGQMGGLLGMMGQEKVAAGAAPGADSLSRQYIQNGSPIDSSAMMQSLFNTQSQGFGGDGSGMGLTNLLQYLSSYPGGGA